MFCVTLLRRERKFFCILIKKEVKDYGIIIPKNKSGGSTAGNLKMLLQRYHHTDNNEVQEKYAPLVMKFAPAKSQKCMTEFFPAFTKKALVTISKDTFVDWILKVICYDSLALSFF